MQRFVNRTIRNYQVSVTSARKRINVADKRVKLFASLEIVLFFLLCDFYSVFKEAG